MNGSPCTLALALAATLLLHCTGDSSPAGNMQCTSLGSPVSDSLCVPTGTACPAGYGAPLQAGEWVSCAGSCCVRCPSDSEIYEGTCVPSHIAQCMRLGGICLLNQPRFPEVARCPEGRVSGGTLDCHLANSDGRLCCLPAPDSGAPDGALDASADGG